MQHIKRALEERIIKALKPNKVLILLGARRIGKTVLLKEIIKKINEPYLLLNGEEIGRASCRERV